MIGGHGKIRTWAQFCRIYLLFLSITEIMTIAQVIVVVSVAVVATGIADLAALAILLEDWNLTTILYILVIVVLRVWGGPFAALSARVFFVVLATPYLQ